MKTVLGLASQNTPDGEQWRCTCGWKSEPTKDDHASMDHALQHWDFHDPEESR